MRIKVDQIHSTPEGLVMGAQIYGPEDSWLRFSMIEVPWSLIDSDLLASIWRHWDREHPIGEDVADTPLPIDFA